MQEPDAKDALYQKISRAERLLEAHRAHPLWDSAVKLLAVSDYAERQLDVLRQLLQEDRGDCAYKPPAYRQDLQSLSLSTPMSAFAHHLRIFRNRHLLRIALREMAGLADTTASMRDWSDCADALILHALDYCLLQAQNRHGVLRDATGATVQLLPLAMGKLGGQELNYSSDVDLIFFCSAEGVTETACQHVPYFTEALQQFTQLLQQQGPGGFVFRVDLRLRPYGESGPLVTTLAGMEAYYQEQGRDWERYAMVKARALGNDPKPEWLERIVTPFVYRRYVDFGVIESLRAMKMMIAHEVHRNPMLDDIKRGRGGIREFEFIIQSFQLIRGGRNAALQQTGALAALEAIRTAKLLPHTARLKAAYLFLRRLENQLQFQQDRQTHALPKDALMCMRLAFALNIPDGSALLDHLAHAQHVINHVFEAQLLRVEGYEDKGRLIASQMLTVWQGQIETEMAVNLLDSLGFSNAKRCCQLLHAFRHGSRCKRLSQAARLRLDRFMVLLLLKLTGVPATDTLLVLVIRMLEQTVGRSAYLALLTENPRALEELLHWFQQSPFLSELVISHPFLLEVLLELPPPLRPPTRRALKDILKQLLAESRDSEQLENALREFRLKQTVLCARAELSGVWRAESAARFLSDVAEVLVGEVVITACDALMPRYPEIRSLSKRFAVIAYGKLGAREMHYGSDLDLVFLHTVEGEAVSVLTRLAQKILNMLTTRLQNGQLYMVDTRLRPSGASGLLLSTMDAFHIYQCESAWAWEHQALLRARMVVGTSKLRGRWYEIKTQVLRLARNGDMLKEAILSMRTRMHSTSEARDALLDIEFLVQFLVLLNARGDWARVTRTALLLTRLGHAGLLPQETARFLREALSQLHTCLHAEVLKGKPESEALMTPLMTRVKAACEAVYAIVSPKRS